MIILREKSYADDNNNKSGMSTGAKVGLGALGTIATGALAFAGARRGMLGKTAAVKTNQTWGNLGSKFGSSGMMNSAAHQLGKIKSAEALTLNTTKGQALRAGVNEKQRLISNWENGGRVTGSVKDGRTTLTFTPPAGS